MRLPEKFRVKTEEGRRGQKSQANHDPVSKHHLRRKKEVGSPRGSPRRGFLKGYVQLGAIRCQRHRQGEVYAKAESALHLMVYGLLNVALIVYRETDSDQYDPDFTVPFYPMVPILGAVFSFGLIAFVSEKKLLMTLFYVLFGFAW